MKPAPSTTLGIALGITLLTTLAGTALGQNALGDGTGLTRDLGRGVPQRRANTAANFQRDADLRNAIVTGNAAGGASFRGDVGYIAPTEFRGQLGSNDLFAFRRDSLFSGLGGMGLRGTEALQYQFGLTTGSASGLLGIGSVSRAGGGIGRQVQSPLADPTLVQEVGAARDPNRPTTSTDRAHSQAWDPPDLSGSMMGMLRTPSAYVVNRGIQPEIVAAFQDPATGFDWGLTASSLRGVRMNRMAAATEQLTRPNAVTSSAAPMGLANPGQPDQVSGVQGATRLPSTATPWSYQSMVDRFRDTAAGRLQAPVAPGTTTPGAPETVDPTAPATSLPGSSVAPGTPEWERRLAEIRERLASDVMPVPSVESGATAPGTTGPAIDPETSPTEGTRAGSLTYRPLDAEALRIIRESGVTINYYIDPTSAVDPYDQHMVVASELMRTGAYFDAEERFTRAQAVRRNDYMATVGRFHAQLGAGMYLSAGVNLRRLLAEHPEVAATKFDAAMLPNEFRMERLIGELRENASRGLDGHSVLLGTDSALLMAYIAHQRGDDALITEALDTYRRLAPVVAADGAAADARLHGQALLDLITQVWGSVPQEAP